MNINELIDSLAALGDYLQSQNEEIENAVQRANAQNKWFTEDNINLALSSVTKHYLNQDKLTQWLDQYDIDLNRKSKSVGLIMAGNIPLVGFHDLLSVLVTGNQAQIKLSSKDQVLTPLITNKLVEINPAFKERINYVERLKDFDAVIATGSNNSFRYFEDYFGKYPHIFRKNRNSVAVLNGNESAADIQNLGKDIFQYFGLGCRSVSKLYIPKDYDLKQLFDQLESFSDILQHDGYKNNYDYNRTLLIMNNTAHLASDFLMIKQDNSLHSPIACLNWEFYKSLDQVQSEIQNRESEIQCVVSKEPLPKAIPFGKAQEPELWDYADGVDTVEFLGTLN